MTPNYDYDVTAALTQAQNLISAPEHWTSGAYARTAAGRACAVNALDAVCWCAMGALRHAIPLGASGIAVARVLARAIQPDEDYTGRSFPDLAEVITSFNDGTYNHEDVLSAFDRAIQLSREEIKS